MVALDNSSTVATITEGLTTPQANTTAAFTVSAAATIAIAFIELSLTGTPDTGITIGAVTFGGSTMTLVPSSKKQSGADGETSGYVLMYYLLNPPTGSQTATLNISGWTGTGILCHFHAATFTGTLNAGAELGTAQKNSGKLVASLTITDTLGTDDIFVGIACNGTAAPTMTTGTSIRSATGSTGSASHNIITARNSGTGSVSLVFATDNTDWSACTGIKILAPGAAQVSNTACTISYVDAVSNNANAAASTGIVVNKPAGVSNRDVLYAFVSRVDFSTTTHFTCAGWTQIGPSAANSGTTTNNDRQLTILRKVITDAANEPSSYTFAVVGFGTTITMVGTIVCFRGVNNTTPEDIAVAAYTTGNNDATPAMQDATSATAGALALTFHLLSMNSGSALKTVGAPSTYTTNANLSSGTTAGSLEHQHAVAYKTLGAAGSTAGTNVWTHTADDSTSEFLTETILLRPCAAVSLLPDRPRKRSMRHLILR